MKIRLIIGSVIFTLLATACSSIAATPTPAPSVDGVSGEEVSLSTNNYAPLVMAYYEGEEIFFIHTEVSDPDVATLLTEMMNGPLVVLVPELVEAPETMLANMYAFTNGVTGHGPFGFQPDVFDSIPGDAEYRPLRAVNLVEWKEGANVRELRTLAELIAAEDAGEVTITRPDIVVNMPVLVWKDGSR